MNEQAREMRESAKKEKENRDHNGAVSSDAPSGGGGGGGGGTEKATSNSVPQPARSTLLPPTCEKIGANGQRDPSLVDNPKDSMYVRYKKSGKRITEELKSMVPKEIFDTDNVNALLEATDYIVEHSLKVERSLLSDLKLSIRVRRRVAKDKHGGGDEGHSYFIDVLVYCWSHLFPHGKKRPEKATAKTMTDPGDQTSSQNRFDMLSLDDDMDDVDDDEDDLPWKPEPRPAQTVPSRLSLQELMDGNDRTDSILFLATLGKMMRFNATRFQKLKEASASIQRGEMSSDLIIELLMEASVATNFAIQDVASLEQVFIGEHPHLNTVYRVFANLIFVNSIQELTSIVTKRSPIASTFSKKDAVEFLGDAIECVFRNPSDPRNKGASLVRDFLKRWQFRDRADVPNATFGGDMSLKQLVNAVQQMAGLEVEIEQEKHITLLLSSFSGEMRGFTWLSDEYIGMNRSITHTIRLVQSLSNLIKDRKGRLALRKGYFGPDFDPARSVSRIPVEMDELLMGDVLPTLINMCYEGKLVDDLPFQNELLTGLVQIKSLVKFPERPVSWTLAFTVHTLLTSLFEIQGGNHFAFLAAAAFRAFNKYMDQLDWALETIPTTISQRPPIWESNLKSLRSLRLLARTPPKFERTPRQAMLSFWNPFCAGAFLLYTAYYTNLEGGTTLIDSVAQLRMTLHLFNALQQVGAMKAGQAPVLDRIFETFKTCKSIWEGPLPTKGQLATRWCLAFGMKACAAELRHGSKTGPSAAAAREQTRVMTPIELEHLTHSWRRICLHDFEGVVDTYFTEQQRRNVVTNKRHGPIYQHLVRVNDTLDGMAKDGRLLATNLISLGHYLNQFCIDLFIELGWMPIVEQFVREATPELKQERRTDFRRVGPNSWEASDDNTKYQSMSHIFAEKILGAFDAGDMSAASRCANFMKVYFNNMPHDKVFWYVPTTV